MQRLTVRLSDVGMNDAEFEILNVNHVVTGMRLVPANHAQNKAKCAGNVFHGVG